MLSSPGPQGYPMEKGGRSVLHVVLVARDVLDGMDLALRRLLVRLFGLFIGDPELEDDLSLYLKLFDARYQFFEAGSSYCYIC